MNHLDLIQSKVYSREALQRQLHVWRFREKKIVFTNGCFDILHLGHIDYLSKAADLGDVLVIGLNTDASVKRLKGARRPINDEHSRALVMASLSFIQAVVLFDEDTPLGLIELVQPDVLVKGADYREEEVVGHEIVNARGGRVVTIGLVPGYSTSLIEEKIRKELP